MFASELCLRFIPKMGKLVSTRWSSRLGILHAGKAGHWLCCRQICKSVGSSTGTWLFFSFGVAFCGVLNLLGSWWFGFAGMLVFWRFHVEKTCFFPYVFVQTTSIWVYPIQQIEVKKCFLGEVSRFIIIYRNGCFLVSCSTGSFEVMRFPFHRHNSRNSKSGSKQSTIEVKNLLISQNWLIKVTPLPYPPGSKTFVSSFILHWNFRVW